MELIFLELTGIGIDKTELTPCLLGKVDTVVNEGVHSTEGQHGINIYTLFGEMFHMLRAASVHSQKSDNRSLLCQVIVHTQKC